MDIASNLQELVERAQRYDVSAFGEIYDLYHKKIFSYVYYKVANRHDAEDITEQVFLKALEHINSFSWKGVPFSAWLFRVASNQVIDYFRSSNRQLLPVDEVEVVELNDKNCPESAAINEMERHDVIVAIRALTDEQQQVIVLRFIVGLSNEEVAYAMSKNVGAIKALQHRAIVSLGKALGDDSDEA